MYRERSKKVQEPQIEILLRSISPTVSVSIPIYPLDAKEHAWRMKVIANKKFTSYAPQLRRDSEHFKTTIELFETPSVSSNQIAWLSKLHEVDPQALPRVERQIAEFIEHQQNLLLPQWVGLRRIANVAHQIIMGTIHSHEENPNP